jgi:hypothetical protein
MDGVIAVAGYLFVQVTVLLARGAVALNLIAAVLLAVLGLRLLLRRTSLCAQADRLPPRPAEARHGAVVRSVRLSRLRADRDRRRERRCAHRGPGAGAGHCRCLRRRTHPRS